MTRKSSPQADQFPSGGQVRRRTATVLIRWREDLNMKNILPATILLAVCFLVIPSLQAAPAKSPDVVTIDSLKDKYEAVRFDHAKHTSLAPDCGTCHHTHGTNSSLPCKECHDLSKEQFGNSVIKTFTACKKCHGSFDRSNPGMPGLKVAYHKKCFQCHRGMADIGTDPKACAGICHPKR